MTRPYNSPAVFRKTYDGRDVLAYRRPLISCSEDTSASARPQPAAFVPVIQFRIFRMVWSGRACLVPLWCRWASVK